MDEKDGSSSYAIDLPNGGLAFVIGNVIQQGPRDREPDHRLLRRRRPAIPRQRAAISSTTQWSTTCRMAGASSSSGMARNRRPAGEQPFRRARQSAERTRRTEQQRYRRAQRDFVNAAAFDYRLETAPRRSVVASIRAAPTASSLRPVAEYVHKAGKRPRSRLGKARPRGDRVPPTTLEVLARALPCRASSTLLCRF